MDELSIKVTIANRIYPLKIKKADEDRVRKAVQMVNDRIKEYELQFGASDKYDHIAMSAMQLASELVNLNESLPAERKEINSALAEMDARISAYLK